MKIVVQEGNIWIYAPNERILMVVDVIFPGWVPFRRLAVSEDIAGWIRRPDIALTFDFDVLVAGHNTRLGNRNDVLIQKPATVPADVDKALQAGDVPPSGLSAEERRAYEQLEKTFKQVDYARLMGSRPQTLYGIADSPVGLAAWLLDHNDAHAQPAATVAAGLRRTTSSGGELTRDEILDNITLYWLTNTGVSASRLYWEYKGGFFNAKGVSIPVAVSIFPGEQYQAPRSWTERAYPNLIYYNKLDKGGHFAAWEEPQLFSAEIRAAFEPLR